MLYLDIWMPSESEIKKQKHASANSRASEIVNIYLTENTEMMVKALKEKDDSHVKVYRGDSHYELVGVYSQFDFNGDGYLLNWSPGIVKNYLQLLGAKLQTGKKYSFSDDVTDKKQLPLLAGKILYCTNEVLNKMGAFAGVNKIRTDADKAEEIAKLFEDYHYDYKVLTSSELEDKILADQEPIYYIIFLNSSKAGKFLAVVNSSTGEIIYSRSKAMSINLKSSDLKDLYKEIK
jgi:hypothetical protein